jgi:hypothetical protein
MKKNYFILEFIKSGPFLLLLTLALLILLGVMISQHRRDIIKMKENVLYVAPAPGK